MFNIIIIHKYIFNPSSSKLKVIETDVTYFLVLLFYPVGTETRVSVNWICVVKLYVSFQALSALNRALSFFESFVSQNVCKYVIPTYVEFDTHVFVLFL